MMRAGALTGAGLTRLTFARMDSAASCEVLTKRAREITCNAGAHSQAPATTDKLARRAQRAAETAS